ncbi:MAG: MotA/TolQ/ExbB proton channel family protein [Verrucomicrobiae bacterium]|nr:MotA/TolQ/ExbB proton channel family protein [Verrucomicrobiae bacterium]
MVLSLTIPPLLASVRAALDQPIFPGKVIVWLLFMLSIIGWVMILSKIVQLRRIRRSDEAFTDRLRQSRTTLEVFEEGWEDEASLKALIYQAGARETAYQLLGSREPQHRLHLRLRQAGKLVGRQIDFLRMAFHTGFRAAAGRLQGGIEGLRLIGAASILLGAFGMVWTLMRGFDEAKEFSDLAPRVGGALGFLAIALVVAAPAVLARIVLRNAVRLRKQDLERFRDDILRLFERSFAVANDTARSSGGEGRGGREYEPAEPEAALSSEAEPDVAPEPVMEPEGERKRYHSIRDRLLRPETDEELSPFRVNPIARQAAVAAGKQGGLY